MPDPDLDAATRADVADVVVRYASGIDRRDWALFRTVFTADCDVDYGTIGRWKGVDEITGYMTSTHELCGHTLHRITNIAVEPTEDGGARARSYVDALILGPENKEGLRATGHYDDELVRTDGSWRIARRTFTQVHIGLVDEGLAI